MASKRVEEKEMSKNGDMLKELVQYAEQLKDEEGFAVIDVKLPDDEDLYNPLSTESNRDLNGDIYDFIDMQANIIPANVPLKIRFHGEADPEKQQQIKEMAHKHYMMRAYDVAWDFAANMRKSLFLIVFGIVVLIAYFAIMFTKNSPLTAEILSIIGSFSLWEAANAILLDRPSLRRRLKNNEQNIEQVMEFVSDKEAEMQGQDL